MSHMSRGRGAEWSAAGALFAFVCWGIWAISGGGDLAGPLLIFLLSLLVAAGLFALARLSRPGGAGAATGPGAAQRARGAPGDGGLP